MNYTIKREPLNALIQRIKDEIDDNHFNMRMWLSSIVDQSLNSPWGLDYKSEEDIPYCKTAGCIAGQVFLGLMTAEERQEALVKFAVQRTMSDTAGIIARAAADKLGLNLVPANVLFVPMSMYHLKNITRQMAVQVLENIRDHGVLNWKAVLPVEKAILLDVKSSYPIAVTVVD